MSVKEVAGTQDYQSYNQSHEYVSVGGVMQLPVAGRTSAHRLIRLHGGYGKRIVNWKATRFGRPPVIPSATDTADDTILNTVVTPNLPRPNEQAGGYDWSVSGTYEYAQDTLRTPGTDAFPVGAYPFSLSFQDTLASLMSHGSSGDFNTKYTALGEQFYDAATGAYVWPFLALAPAFSSGDLI